MVYRYTAEEAFELIMNDEFGEMESCDSFDTDEPVFLILILNQEYLVVQEVEIPEGPEKELESKLKVIGVYHQLGDLTLLLWITTQ